MLESASPPPPSVVAKVAHDCGLAPDKLTFIYAPTQSLTGSVQVVARVLEVALAQGLRAWISRCERIVDGIGAAPLCPPHPDFVTAMGRTNDAIIYAGQVQLFVTGPADDARALAEKLPSEGSRDYGRPFAEIFKRVKGDFYAIDPMLFSPAAVIVTALETGESFRAGRVNLEPARCLLRVIRATKPAVAAIRRRPRGRPVGLARARARQGAGGAGRARRCRSGCRHAASTRRARPGLRSRASRACPTP